MPRSAESSLRRSHTRIPYTTGDYPQKNPSSTSIHSGTSNAPNTQAIRQPSESQKAIEVEHLKATLADTLAQWNERFPEDEMTRETLQGYQKDLQDSHAEIYLAGNESLVASLQDNSDKEDLIYPLRIALSDTFPKYLTDSDGRQAALRQNTKGELSLVAVTKRHQNDLIPTSSQRPSFLEFVIQAKKDSFITWKDKIYAGYHILLKNADYKGCITLPNYSRDTKIPELKLLIGTLEEAAGPGTLLGQRMAFYYEMLFRAAPLRAQCDWEAIFQGKVTLNASSDVDPTALSDWILQLCQYSIMLRDIKAKKEVSREAKDDLFQAICANHFTQQFFNASVESIKETDFQKEIDRILSNIASPCVSRSVSENKLALDRAFKEPREELERTTLAFYYEMLLREAPESALCDWEAIFQGRVTLNASSDVDPTALSDWIFQLCQYSIMLRDIKAKKEVSHEAKDDLFQAICANHFTQQFFNAPVESIEETDFQKEIDHILSTLAVPTISRLVLKNKLSLEEAFKASPETLDRKIRESKTQAQPSDARYGTQISNYWEFVESTDDRSHFYDFLEHINLTSKGLLKMSIQADTLDDVIQYLFSPGVLQHICTHSALFNFRAIIETKGLLEEYLKGLPLMVDLQNITRYETLDKFIANYNQNDKHHTNGTINLTPEEKKALRSLGKYSKSFKEGFRKNDENGLAKEALQNCKELFYALEEYGNLPSLLRDKKFPEILSLASRYSTNVNSEIVLKSIRDSGLPLEIALTLTDEARAKLKDFHANLYAMLTRCYILESNEEYAKNNNNRSKKEYCEKVVFRRIKRALEDVSDANNVKIVLDEELKQFEDPTIKGLVQRKVLHPEELLDLESPFRTRLFQASVDYNGLSDGIKAWVRRKGYDHFTALVERNEELKNVRKELNRLREGTEEDRALYLKKREEFFEAVAESLQCINMNLKGPHAESIAALTNSAEIAFHEAMALSQTEREEIKQDCDKALEMFGHYQEFIKSNSTPLSEGIKELAKAQEIETLTDAILAVPKNNQAIPTPQDIKGLAKAQEIETLADVIRAVRKDNQAIPPKKVYPYTYQLINASLSPTASPALTTCYKKGLLAIGQIARLEDEAVKQLKKSLELFTPIGQNEQNFVKALFKHHIPKEGDITTGHINQIIQDYKKALQYSKMPFLRKILTPEDSEDTSKTKLLDSSKAEAFIKAVIAPNQPAPAALKEELEEAYSRIVDLKKRWESYKEQFKNSSKSREDIQSEINRLRKDTSEVNQLLAYHQEPYDDFLSRVFLAEFPNQNNHFPSLQDILTCCNRYLANLKSPLAQDFNKHGIDPITVLTADTESRESFNEHFTALTTLIDKTVDQDTLNTLTANIAKKKNVHADQYSSDSESELSEHGDTQEPPSAQLVWQFIKVSSPNLKSIIQDIAQAQQKIDKKDNRILIEHGLHITIAMRLSEQLFQRINTFFETVKKMLPKGTPIPYRAFSQHINKVFKPKTPTDSESSLDQLVSKLEEPLITQWLRLEPEKIERNLKLLLEDERINLTVINKYFKSANQNKKIQKWIAKFGYSDLSNLVAQHLNNLNRPPGEIEIFLKKLLEIEKNHSRTVSSLTSQGKSSKPGVAIPFLDILSVATKDIGTLYKKRVALREKGYKVEVIKAQLMKDIENMEQLEYEAALSRDQESQKPTYHRDDQQPSPDINPRSTRTRKRRPSTSPEHREQSPSSRQTRAAVHDALNKGIQAAGNHEHRRAVRSLNSNIAIQRTGDKGDLAAKLTQDIQSMKRREQEYEATYHHDDQPSLDINPRSTRTSRRRPSTSPEHREQSPSSRQPRTANYDSPQELKRHSRSATKDFYSSPDSFGGRRSTHENTTPDKSNDSPQDLQRAKRYNSRRDTGATPSSAPTSFFGSTRLGKLKNRITGESVSKEDVYRRSR